MPTHPYAILQALPGAGWDLATRAMFLAAETVARASPGTSAAEPAAAEPAAEEPAAADEPAAEPADEPAAAEEPAAEPADEPAAAEEPAAEPADEPAVAEPAWSIGPAARLQSMLSSVPCRLRAIVRGASAGKPLNSHDAFKLLSLEHLACPASAITEIKAQGERWGGAGRCGEVRGGAGVPPSRCSRPPAPPPPAASDLYLVKGHTKYRLGFDWERVAHKTFKSESPVLAGRHCPAAAHPARPRPSLLQRTRRPTCTATISSTSLSR